MGLLNSKTRVIDVVMTQNGRASLASKGLNIAYASFTDGQTFYDVGSISGSFDDAINRIFLESSPSLPQDTLTLTTDDSGDLIPFSAFGASIDTKGTLYISGSTPVSVYQTGSDFSSAVKIISNMFQTSFNYNSFIATREPLDSESDFSVLPSAALFELPIELEENSISEIDAVDSLFFDKRFANLPQFKFLPPVVSLGNSVSPLGRFKNIKSFNQYTYDDLKAEVFGTDEEPNKPRYDFNFTSTTQSNDIVIQLFEITNNSMTKLDVVDYGEVIDYEDREHQQKRILFFGKVYLDNTETATFVNLFTVVID